MDERSQELIQRINNTIADAQEILLNNNGVAGLERIPDLFQELSDLAAEIGQRVMAEIFLDLSEVITRILADHLVKGDSHQIRAVREAAYLSTGIAYRQMVNEELCDEEIASLNDLTQSIRFGDSIGFQVTDKAQLKRGDDRITLFEDDPTEESGDSGAKAVTSRPLKMLIVDDEGANRILLKNILVGLGEIELALDGQEAVEAFQMGHKEGAPFDVIFLDIMMPNMDGHKALEVIRTMEKEMGVEARHEVIIFMVSCLDTPQHVCQAFFKEYCTDYIVKPVAQGNIFNKMAEYGLIVR